jgi:biotin carboxyl carrier protein
MSMTNNVAVSAELQGTIVGLFVEVGASVRAGEVMALVESMKMHHEVTAPVAGVIDSLAIDRVTPS